jgi:nitrate reductase gamma subunit
LNAKISKYVLGVFVVIALILSTVLLIIRSIKKRKIRKC